MAKKRKLRSSASEPQSEQHEEQLQLQEEPQIHPESVTEDEPHETETMAVDIPIDEADGEEGGEGKEGVQEELVEDDEVEEEVEEDHEDQEDVQNQTLDASNDALQLAAAQPQANGAEEETNGVEFDEEPVDSLLEPLGKDQLVVLLKRAVEKFPELIESIREVADADPAHRKIFVHGLGWDATAETLRAEFGKYGEIEDCKAVTDRVSGKSKGYAFILFKHRSGARNALKEPQKKIGNRTTSSQLASAGPVPAPPPTMPPVSEYTQRKIFVSNVSADIDPQKLLEFFKQFGEVEDGPLGLDKQTGKPKGFALFVYKSVESAKRALEEPHKTFEGHTLHCQRAVDGPKQSKPFGGHNHHHHQPHYSQRKEKNKYSSGGPGHGHLMAPAAPAVGFNPGMPPQALNPALGQALSALLATQGAGLGLGNLLGGLGGAPMNQAGPPAGYGNLGGMSYGNQPMQGGYQNPHMGQSSGGRPQQGGGAPYMGH